MAAGIAALRLLEEENPYARLDALGRRLRDATLAAVLGIVQGHGGLLTLDSDTERGTRFGMLLPLPSERPAAEVCATQPGYGARS